MVRDGDRPGETISLVRCSTESQNIAENWLTVSFQHLDAMFVLYLTTCCAGYCCKNAIDFCCTQHGLHARMHTGLQFACNTYFVSSQSPGKDEVQHFVTFKCRLA